MERSVESSSPSSRLSQYGVQSGDGVKGSLRRGQEPSQGEDLKLKMASPGSKEGISRTEQPLNGLRRPLPLNCKVHVQ